MAKVKEDLMAGVESTIKIFLLTPSDGSKQKIVWADDVEGARDAADMQPFKEINPGGEIPIKQDGIYTNQSTKCEDVTNQITNTEQFNRSVVHFDYEGKRIHLGKGKAENLDRFQSIHDNN